LKMSKYQNIEYSLWILAKMQNFKIRERVFVRKLNFELRRSYLSSKTMKKNNFGIFEVFGKILFAKKMDAL
jgi:hypothetical protein